MTSFANHRDRNAGRVLLAIGLILLTSGLAGLLCSVLL